MPISEDIHWRTVEEERPLPEHILVESIVRKVKKAVMKTEPTRVLTAALPYLGRGIVYSLPAALYRQFKGGFNELCSQLDRSGFSYEYNPEELIWASLLLLKSEGKFLPEEEKFIDENRVIIKRLIFEKIPFSVMDPRQEVVEKDTYRDTVFAETIGAIFEAARYAVGKIVSLNRQPGEETETHDLLHMHELNLLDTHPARIGECPKIPKDEKTEFYKRLLGIGKEISDESLLEIIKREKDILKGINRDWRDVVANFYGKEKLERYGFPKEVERCNDFFELYRMLDITRSVHIINCARIKLILYLTTAEIRLKPAYTLRHSIKMYLDGYLGENIFSDFEKVTLYVSVDEQDGKEHVAVSTKRPVRAGYVMTNVLGAYLKNPITGEKMRIYIYEGNSDDNLPPELEERGKKRGLKDIVNEKSRVKLALKRLAIRREPRDYHRMTVMPVVNSEEELQRLRDFLDQTITHPQNRDFEWVAGRQKGTNPASALDYRMARAQNVDVVLAPYHEGKRGYILDEMTGESVRIGHIGLEVRTGLPTLLAEKHKESMLHHGAYTQIRIMEALGKLLPPKIYPDNWVPLLSENLRELYRELEDRFILPGLIQTKVQELRLQIKSAIKTAPGRLKKRLQK